MKTVTFTLKGASPYGQSRAYTEPAKEDKESHDAYEKRTWRERMHATELGYVFQPPMGYKNALSSVAKYLGEKIPGKRNATYTKHFEAGIFIMDTLVLPVKKDDVPGTWLFVPADGVRGSGKRVWKCFPTIHEWQGDLPVHILDEIITPRVLVHHMEEAGKFVGVGFFRPERNGFWGRFRVEAVDGVPLEEWLEKN